MEENMPDLKNISEAAQQELTVKLNDLPLSLTVSDVASFLGICLTTAYKLVAQESFPKVKMPGVKRVVIPKVKFVEWYLNSEN